jgi:hypothetical protein
MNARVTSLRVLGTLGAVVGYGCLAAFLYLVAVQIYRWFRDGEWSHIGVIEGLRSGVQHCCIREGGSGRFVDFVQWLDSPGDWLGMHQVLEIVPASLALFAASIAGNAVFIFCKDRWENR